jgi:8-oxo-dGTP pyrophosphatase MutT (NUDIX family)
MDNRAYGLFLRAFGRLPRRVRRVLIHLGAPSFSVGAMCVIEGDDGDLLLVRQSYRDGWGVPGGLLRRREEPAAGAVREAEEEIGLVVDLQGEPVVIIDARVRRIDVVFRCRIRPPVPDVVAPASVEIAEVRWFPRDALPRMQRETAEALRRVL